MTKITNRTVGNIRIVEVTGPAPRNEKEEAAELYAMSAAISGVPSNPRPPYNFEHDGRSYIEDQTLFFGPDKDQSPGIMFRPTSMLRRMFYRGLFVPFKSLKRDDEKKQWVYVTEATV